MDFLSEIGYFAIILMACLSGAFFTLRISAWITVPVLTISVYYLSSHPEFVKSTLTNYPLTGRVIPVLAAGLVMGLMFRFFPPRLNV